MVDRPAVDDEEPVARLSEPIDAEAVGRRIDHPSEARLEHRQLSVRDDALEYRLLDALPEPFARLRHLAQPPASRQAVRRDVVGDEHLHGCHRARNAG